LIQVRKVIQFFANIPTRFCKEIVILKVIVYQQLCCRCVESH